MCRREYGIILLWLTDSFSFKRVQKYPHRVLLLSQNVGAVQQSREIFAQTTRAASVYGHCLHMEDEKRSLHYKWNLFRHVPLCPTTENPLSLTNSFY